MSPCDVFCPQDLVGMTMGFGDGETGLGEQKWRKQDDVASLHFFCDGSSLGCCILPSKQDSIATDVTLGGLPISVKKICNRD